MATPPAGAGWQRRWLPPYGSISPSITSNVEMTYLSGNGTHASLAAEYKTSRQRIADAVRAYADMPDAIRAREGLWLSMQLSKLPRRLPDKGGYIHLPNREAVA